MEYINRQVLTVRPGQPFADWVHRVDEQLGFEDNKLDPEVIRSSTSVYLFRDFDSRAESLKYLRRRGVNLIEEELAGWITDPELWPDNPSWELFDRWMDWELYDSVIDIERQPIKHLGFSSGSLVGPPDDDQRD